jgi:hypothetical protein
MRSRLFSRRGATVGGDYARALGVVRPMRKARVTRQVDAPPVSNEQEAGVGAGTTRAPAVKEGCQPPK